MLFQHHPDRSPQSLGSGSRYQRYPELPLEMQFEFAARIDRSARQVVGVVSCQFHQNPLSQTIRLDHSRMNGSSHVPPSLHVASLSQVIAYFLMTRVYATGVPAAGLRIALITLCRTPSISTNPFSSGTKPGCTACVI